MRDIQKERRGYDGEKSRSRYKVRCKMMTMMHPQQKKLIQIERDKWTRGKKEERKRLHNYCGCQKKANQMALGTAGLCSTQLVEEVENGL